MTPLSKLLPLLLAAAAGSVQAQGAPAVELRYTTGSPPKAVWATQINRYAQAAEDESRGSLKIAVFTGSQLGAENDTIHQVARGRIDMGAFTLNATMLLAPELSALSLPFYFKSPAELDCVLDSALTGPVTEIYARHGLQFLDWGEIGSVDLVGKRAFVQPADAQGVKAGTYGNRVYATMWSGLGANPTALTLTEMSAAFQTGLIDVWTTVSTYYVPSGLNKIAPVLTRLDLVPVPGVILMNKAAWERLSPQQRDSLQRAGARDPADARRREVRAFEAEMREAHRSGGGQIVSTSADERAAWRRAVAPMWPAMLDAAGPEARRLFEQVEAARAACEKRS